MNTTTLPLSLFAAPDFMSLKERRAQSASRANSEHSISTIEKFKQNQDLWVESLQSFENSEHDSNPREGKVSIDSVPVKRDWGRSYLEGDATISDGEVTNARYSIETVTDSDLWVDAYTFQRTANTTLYVESGSNGERTLLLDHKKGTLTYTTY